MFLTNCWYIAAWSRDIQDDLNAKTLLDEELVLFRQSDGKVVALENACPHRKLPLSKGRLCGDIVECGYHGMQFDASGTCVRVPTQSRIPTQARVKTYPVAEKWGFVWVWLGDPTLASEDKIYEIAGFDDPGWGKTVGGTLAIDCNYLWLTDNLLDPSHVAWVHTTSFASPGTDDTPLSIKTLDDGVIVSRWILNQPVPPYYSSLVPFDGPCDRLQHYEVRVPSVCINRSVFTPAGTGGDVDNLPDNAYIMISYNFMTPVSDDATTYFWIQHYNTDGDDPAIAQQLNDGAIAAFNEDKAVLEAVHLGMKHRKTPNLDLALDAGSLRFRKLLDNAIAAEGERQMPEEST